MFADASKRINTNNTNSREKLGIPEDESVSIQNAVEKRKQQAKKLEELLQQNKVLVEENLELKSDVRHFLLASVSSPSTEAIFIDDLNFLDTGVEI